MKHILQNVICCFMSLVILTFSRSPKKSDYSLEASEALCEGQLLRHVPGNNHCSAFGICMTIMLHIIENIVFTIECYVLMEKLFSSYSTSEINGVAMCQLCLCLVLTNSSHALVLFSKDGFQL